MADETEGPKPPGGDNPPDPQPASRFRIIRPDEPAAPHPPEPTPERQLLIPGSIFPSPGAVAQLLRDFLGNAERGYLAGIAVVAVRTEGGLALGVVGNETTWPSLAGGVNVLSAEIVGKIYDTISPPPKKGSG